MGFSNPNSDTENAFLEGKAKKVGNTQTDGKVLLLFGTLQTVDGKPTQPKTI